MEKGINNRSPDRGHLKEKASRLSIIVIAFLIVMKLVASFITGSIGMRADAIHSVIDLIGAVIGYIAIRIARKPPDKQHAFGHGKTEDIAGFIIAILIFIAAVSIVYEAAGKMIEGSVVGMVSIGIYVTAAAIVINIFISWYVFRVARATESIALEATARDMTADIMSSVAVLLGLILVKFTGFTIIDSVVALIVSILIGKAAYDTMRKSIRGLMDTKLPEEEEEKIRSTVLKRTGEFLDVHQLRSRKSGDHRYVDFHVVVPKDMSVERAHELCDQVESEIKQELPKADVTIHIEPCLKECENCGAECSKSGKGGYG